MKNQFAGGNFPQKSRVKKTPPVPFCNCQPAWPSTAVRYLSARLALMGRIWETGNGMTGRWDRSIFREFDRLRRRQGPKGGWSGPDVGPFWEMLLRKMWWWASGADSASPSPKNAVFQLLVRGGRAMAGWGVGGLGGWGGGEGAKKIAQKSDQV